MTMPARRPARRKISVSQWALIRDSVTPRRGSEQCDRKQNEEKDIDLSHEVVGIKKPLKNITKEIVTPYRNKGIRIRAGGYANK